MSARGGNDELDDDARALLRAMRRASALPPDVRDRVWTRLEHSTAPAAMMPWRRIAIAGLAAAAAILVIAALWNGRASTAIGNAEGTPRDQAVYGQAREGAAATAGVRAGSEARVSAREADARDEGPDRADESGREATAAGSPGSTPRPAEPAHAQEGGERPRAGTPSRAARSPAPSEAEPPSTLAQEIAAIEAIRAALLADAPDRALEHVKAHARRFPRGALVQEREALHAVALCTKGDSAGAAKADAFIAAHPRSPLVAKVRAACASEAAMTPP